MGLSFRFNPFKQQQPVAGHRGSQSHFGNNEDTESLNKERSDREHHAAPEGEGIHYGKAHAETEERYRERARERRGEDESRGSDLTRE